MLMKKKKFIVIALDPKHKIFIIYLAFFTNFDFSVYPFCRPQIITLIAK